MINAINWSPTLISVLKNAMLYLWLETWKIKHHMKKTEGDDQEKTTTTNRESERASDDYIDIER